MSTEAQQSYGAKEPIGPRMADDTFTHNHEVLVVAPDTVREGFEAKPPTPAERSSFDQGRADVRESHNSTTAVETEPWYKKRIVQLGAVAAVAATVAGAIGMSLGGDSDKVPQPRATAVGTPTPGENPTTPSPTTSVEGDSPRSAREIAKSLTIPTSVYSSEFMKKYDATDARVEKLTKSYAFRSESSVAENQTRLEKLSTALTKELDKHEATFNTFTAEDLIGAQSNFQNMMELKTFDLSTGTPKEMTAGAYLSRKREGIDHGYFPQLAPTQDMLSGMNDGPDTMIPVQPFLAESIISEGSRLYGETIDAAANNRAITRYNQELPEDKKNQTLTATFSETDLANASFPLGDRFDPLKESRLANARENAVARTYGDGVVLKSLERTIDYGIESIKLEGLSVAYAGEKPDEFVIQTVVMLPLEFHYVDGKKVNEPYVYPLTIDIDSLQDN